MINNLKLGTTRTLMAALSLAALAISIAPAIAAASCPSASTSKPFTRFGDENSYSLLQGGSFESGAQGWSLSGASVVKGNESYEVIGGSHSLSINPTGVAVSPSFCVSTGEPAFRFFARQTSGSWAVLTVSLRWSEASGTTHETTVGTLQSGSSWTPSQAMKLAGDLPLWMSGSTLSARLVFKPEPYGGGWAIDDVFIDPYSR
jgi:hypothetical protein